MNEYNAIYTTFLTQGGLIIVKSIGIVKEIDDLGRLQIPKDIRTRLGLKKKIQLVITENGLLIKSEEYKLVPLDNDNSNQT